MTRKSILMNLADYPTHNGIFIWSDYVELRCLVHPDRSFSRSTLMETKEEMEEVVGEVEGDEFGEEYESDEDDESDVYDLGSPPEKQDKLDRKSSDIFSHIGSRAKLFGDDLYPFIVDAEAKSITLKEDIGIWHCVYIQLLLSSVLRYVPKTRRQEITDRFEVVSHQIFKQLMPNGWEVHQFGKNSSTRYTGHLFDKLSALADDVRGTMVAKKTDFDANDRGDGGLDLVAWHPLGDLRRSLPIAFAQCGCTVDDYGPKTLEASPAMLASKIAVTHNWSTYYFMPQALHDGNDWIGFKKFGSAIVLDRFRIMKLAHQYTVDTSNLFNPELIKEARSLAFT